MKKVKAVNKPVPDSTKEFGQLEQDEQLKLGLSDMKQMENDRLNPPTKRYTVSIENELGGSIVEVKNVIAQTKYEAIEKVKNNLVFTAISSGKY